MTITKDEALEIRRTQEENSKDIALLKQTSENVLTAVNSQADSHHELTAKLLGVADSMKDLTSAISEDRIRREAHEEKHDIQNEFMTNQVNSNTDRHDFWRDNYKPSADRSKKFQERIDWLIKSMFSAAGITFITVACALALYFLGINPKDFTGG